MSSVTRSHTQASRRETLAFAFNVAPHACCVEEGRDALALRKGVLIGPPLALDRDGFNAVIACFAAHHPLSLIVMSFSSSSFSYRLTDASPWKID